MTRQRTPFLGPNTRAHVLPSLLACVIFLVASGTPRSVEAQELTAGEMLEILSESINHRLETYQAWVHKLIPETEVEKQEATPTVHVASTALHAVTTPRSD